MKILILLVFLIISISGFSQVPDYFANKPEWRVSYKFGGYGDCLIVNEYVEYIKGDTLINGKFYQKMYSRGYEYEIWLGPLPSHDCDFTKYYYNHIAACVRQEGRKVYVIIPSENEEQLLYDFDLKVGDTLPVTSFCFPWGGLGMPGVIAIDSLMIGNEYRKVFETTSIFFGNLYEGIGFGGGFLGDCSIFSEFPSDLRCFAINGTPYLPELNGECELNVGFAELPGNLNPLVYPNPASDFFMFEAGRHTENLLFKLYSFSGGEIEANFKKLEQGKYLFDIAKLAKGVYLLKYTDEIKLQGYVKIIKQ